MRSTFYVVGSAVNDDLLRLLQTLKTSWVIIDDDADFSGTRRLMEVVPNVVYMTARAIRAEWSVTGTKDYAEAMRNINSKALAAGLDAERLWYGLLDKPQAEKIETRRLAQWLSDVLAVLDQAHMRLVVGNIDMSLVERGDINNGYFDALLQSVSHYKSQAVLGLYETTSMLYPYGAGYLDRWSLLEPSELQADQWPEQMHGQRNDLLRAQWLQNRAKKLNLNELPVVVTQLALGRTAALNSGRNTVYDVALRRFGSPMKQIEGPYSLKQVWDAYWPSLTFAQAYIIQLQWVESIYPSYILAYALKSWGGEDQYDHSHDLEFHNKLALAHNQPVIHEERAEPAEDVESTQLEDESEWPLLEVELIPYRDADIDAHDWLTEILEEETYLHKPASIPLEDRQQTLVGEWKTDEPIWIWRPAYITSDGDFTNVRQYASTTAPVVGHVTKETLALIDPMQSVVEEDFIWIPIRINLLGDESRDFSNRGWIRNDVITYRFQYTDDTERVDSPTHVSDINIQYERNNQHHMGLMGILHSLLEVMRKTDIIVAVRDYSVTENGKESIDG